jgi:hypothetical protein
MSKGDSTKKRSFFSKVLVLAASLFAVGAVDKATLAREGAKHTQGHASGTGWGSGAIYAPKRKKFKGYLRNTSTFNKKKRGLK